jgi:hypothetical protein
MGSIGAGREEDAHLDLLSRRDLSSRLCGEPEGGAVVPLDRHPREANRLASGVEERDTPLALRTGRQDAEVDERGIGRQRAARAGRRLALAGGERTDEREERDGSGYLHRTAGLPTVARNVRAPNDNPKHEPASGSSPAHG